MKNASISELKNNLSAYIDVVRGGEVVTITDRNRPVARLEPVGNGTADDDAGRLSRLERAGVIRQAKNSAPAELKPFVKNFPRKTGALAALLAEREESR